ncbi:MAG TPA: hypothetical protein VJI15_01140 [Candidatus Nanoarchaeia archaeon]|nr:hypothetical protein [Candidatus Nanoarchaeia archaeon]
MMQDLLGEFLNRSRSSLTLDHAFFLYQQVLRDGRGDISFLGTVYDKRLREGYYYFLIEQSPDQMSQLSSGVLRGTMHQLGAVPTSIEGKFSEARIAYDRRAFPDSTPSELDEDLALQPMPPPKILPLSDFHFVLRYEARYDPERWNYVGSFGKPGILGGLALYGRKRFELKRIAPPKKIPGEGLKALLGI